MRPSLPKATAELPRVLVPARAAALLLVLSACAVAPPPPIVQRAPLAVRPSLLGVFHTKLRPTRQGGTVAAGELRELRACPFDGRVAELPPGGGVQVRLESPVPLDLKLQVDTSQGQRPLLPPEDLEDEQRLFRRGQGFYYENSELTRKVATGKVSPRELWIWPGADATEDRRVDLSIRTVSFDPRASGDERESQALFLSMVGVCADFALSVSRDAVEVRQAASRRIFVSLKPLGDGVRSMKTTLLLEGLPKGVTAPLREPVVTGADWTSPRETTFDLDVAADASPGVYKLSLKGTLGAVEHRAPLELTIKPKPE